MHQFTCYGPYDLDKGAYKETWKDRFSRWKRNFIDQADGDHDGLSGAHGCYAFCMRYGSNYTPWYVGKTTAEKGFAGEVFSKVNQAHYQTILSPTLGTVKWGTPCIMLFPKIRSDGNMLAAKGPPAKAAVGRLEDQLIHMAWMRNADLVNVSGVKTKEKLSVEGLIGPQEKNTKPDKSMKAARKAFGTAMSKANL